VGAGQVIKGWDKGLLGRKEQEQFRLKIPSELGYGKKGVPPLIMPDETLYFDLYILKILPPLTINEPSNE
jgi:FKBP-type peptidyl-prolyl cis-trans isomerase